MQENLHILEMAEIMWHSSLAKLTLNPVRVGSVKLLLDNFETHRVCHSNKQITLPLLLPNRFFFHPDSGWSHDQLQPGSFSQLLPRKAEKREPGTTVDIDGD